MTGPFSGPHWPNVRQRLLLAATVGNGEAAASAWRAWVEAGGLVDVDASSYEILPSVLSNLTAQGAIVPEEGVLRGLHRRTWYQNRTMLASTTELIRELENAGIQTIVLKGAALLALYYSDAGQRYMVDTDVLVHQADAERAFEILHSAGWQSRSRSEAARQRVRRLAHAFTFRAGEQYIDLHWDVMLEARPPGTEAGYWERAVPVVVDGAQTRSLSPADLLIHIIVHSYRWAPTATLRWIVDTIAITRGTEHPVDWKVLVSEARRLRVTLMVGRSLEYAASLGAPVPPPALDALYRSRRGWVEKLHYRGNTASPAPVNSVLREISYYLRISGDWPLHRRVREIPAYFQMVWGVPSPQGLPGEAWQRLRGHRRQHA
jgi:hypothetical protein